MDPAEWAGAMECAAAGEWEAAAAGFMRAPRSARTLHNAGVCYARLGDDDGNGNDGESEKRGERCDTAHEREPPVGEA